MLHANNFLYEDTGSDRILLGWQYADQVFRMLLHQPVLRSEDIPQRVFTRANVASLDLTRWPRMGAAASSRTGVREALGVR